MKKRGIVKIIEELFPKKSYFELVSIFEETYHKELSKILKRDVIYLDKLLAHLEGQEIEESIYQELTQFTTI